MIRLTCTILAALCATGAAYAPTALEGLAHPTKITVARYGLVVLMLLALTAATLHRQLSAMTWKLANGARRRFPGVIRFRPHAGQVERLLLAALIAALPVFALLVLLIPEQAAWIAREDGPLEYLSAAFYLIAAACAGVAWHRHSGQPLLRWHLAALGLLVFVVGMEEISWGQRLLGFETPPVLRDLNVQGEMTLHNIWSSSLTVYPALAVVTLLLCVLPLANRFSLSARKLMQALQFPVAAAVYGWLFVAFAALYITIGIRLGIPTPLPITWYGWPRHIDEEYLEFCIAAAFLAIAVGGWRLQVAGRDTVEDVGQVPTSLE